MAAPAPHLGPLGASAAAPLHADAPYRSALVVANPIAGRGKGQAAAEELREGLRRMGVSAEVHLTSGRGDGWRRVRSMGPEVDLVISVGGDGTLREVLSGLVDADTHVAQLPLGTANLLAAQLRLPRDVHHCLEIVARRRTFGLDGARVNGRACYLCAGVGIDGLVVREVERRRTGPIRKWAYVRAMARVLANYRPPELELEVDGERVGGRFAFVLVGNLSIYGAFFKLSAAARPDDGRYEVYAMRRADLTALARLAVQGVVSRLPGKLGTLWQARRVVVRSAEPVPFQVDGDLAGETPFELELSGLTHRILAP